MNIRTHSIFQSIFMLIQGIDIADLGGKLSLISHRAASLILFTVSALQAIIGLYGHYFNPDGSLTPLKNTLK